MSGTILTETKGFTPVIDALAAEVGLIPAAVYGIVWRHCQMRDGVCKASLQTMADKLGCDRSTLKRHLRTLCEAGYVEDTTPDRKNAPHVYRDTGRVKIRALLEVGLEVGQSDPPNTERSCGEHDQGGAERPTRIPCQETREEETENTPAAGAAEADTLPDVCLNCFKPIGDGWEDGCECNASPTSPHDAPPDPTPPPVLLALLDEMTVPEIQAIQRACNEYLFSDNPPDPPDQLRDGLSRLGYDVDAMDGEYCAAAEEVYHAIDRLKYTFKLPPAPDIPRRVQRSRQKGAKLPPNTICVTRGTRWGNLHHVGDDGISDATAAVMAHRRTIRAMKFSALWELIEPLQGKNLACWCALDAPCHADTLLALAAMDREELREWWAPCEDCGKPRTTTRKYPRMDQLCRCGKESLSMPETPTWREQAAQPWAGWAENHGLVQQAGIELTDLGRVGWLIEHHTGLAPVAGDEVGWSVGLAGFYRVTHGDWDVMEAAVAETQTWEAGKRPTTVKCRRGQDNTFMRVGRRQWAAKQKEETPPATPRADAQAAQLNQALGRRKAAV